MFFWKFQNVLVPNPPAPPNEVPPKDVVVVPVFSGALEKLNAGVACVEAPKPNVLVELALLCPDWNPPAWGNDVPKENGAAVAVEVAGAAPKEKEEVEAAGLEKLDTF